ncbi:LysR family transcriptional regulator [Embleya sp. NPDC005971]|uniref:LysR family transcriptional regulator n=1 Tax=unclassified Embleya TaxID=2699296 RepID=UPI0033DF636A
MDMELRHLRTIRAIADAGSLTRASAVLGLAQPALSTQLKRIEKALGGALFERGREGVTLTPLGELVLDRARVLLPAARQLQEEAVRFANRGEVSPRFRLGGTHGPLLGGLVHRLAEEHSADAVTTHISWSNRELAAMVATGRLDFVLLGACGESRPASDGGLAWREVGTDPVFLMLAHDHPLAGEPEVDLAALAGETWAVVPGEGCFGDCFSTACARAGFAPKAIYETDVASCVYLAQVGRAVGLCRATMPPTPGIVRTPLAGVPLSWRHLIGWHPHAPAAHTAALVTAQVRAAHAAAVRNAPRYSDWLARHDGRGYGTAN